jgi:hypothetical protein
MTVTNVTVRFGGLVGRSMRFGAPIELRVSNILARVVLFNACALAIDHDTVRQAHLADCTFCDSVLRRFVFWGGHGGLDLQ